MVKKPQGTFIAKEERVRSLEILLDSFPDVVREPKERDQIMRSFKFKINAAFIKLFSKRTERREKFIEELGQFFFVGEAYFYLEPKDSKLFGMIIVSRFKDLFDVATYNAKKYKGQFEKVTDLLWILFDTPFKKICPPQERVKELETFVDYWDYQDIFTDGFAVRDILEAFKSEKPITSLELRRKKPQAVKTFLEGLKKFFTIGKTSSLLYQKIIFVSHCENLLHTIIYHSDKHEGAFDQFAGLAGVLLLNLKRHPVENIAFYCFDERLKEYHLIK